MPHPGFASQNLNPDFEDAPGMQQTHRTSIVLKPSETQFSMITIHSPQRESLGQVLTTYPKSVKSDFTELNSYTGCCCCTDITLH